MKVGLAAEYLARSVLMMLLVIIASIGYFGQTMPLIKPLAAAQEAAHAQHMVGCMYSEWRNGKIGTTDITIDGAIFLDDGTLTLTLTCAHHWKTYFDTSAVAPGGYTTCINWNNVYPPPPHQEILQGKVVASLPPHLQYKGHDRAGGRIVCFGTRYDQQ